MIIIICTFNWNSLETSGNCLHLAFEPIQLINPFPMSSINNNIFLLDKADGGSWTESSESQEASGRHRQQQQRYVSIIIQ